MGAVELDLNNPRFQKQWFALQREESDAVVAMLRKVHGLSWEQIYRDTGLRWEAIISRESRSGGRLYSLRVTRKIRAVARRDGNTMRLLSLHCDHDSAYQ